MPLFSIMSQFGSIFRPAPTLEEEDLEISVVELVNPDDCLILPGNDVIWVLIHILPVGSRRYPSMHWTHSFLELIVLQF